MKTPIPGAAGTCLSTKQNKNLAHRTFFLDDALFFAI
jgi:hypothetical protein